MLEALAVSNDGESVANDDVCVWCGVFLYTVLNDPVVCGQGTHLFKVPIHTCSSRPLSCISSLPVRSSLSWTRARLRWPRAVTFFSAERTWQPPGGPSRNGYARTWRSSVGSFRDKRAKMCSSWKPSHYPHPNQGGCTSGRYLRPLPVWTRGQVAGSL